MDFLQVFACTFSAYLIGSIPTSIWLGKLYFGIDIREHGSGSASHLNVYRIMGIRPSILVRILDILKGFLAANLAYFVHNRYGFFVEYELEVLMMTFGLSALLGHIFPIFASFRGGKGIHVSLGIFAAILPAASAVFIGVACCIFLLSRYPNLAYVLGAVAIPIYVWATRSLHGTMLLPTLIFSLFIALMLFLTHRKNLMRIIHGEAVQVQVSFRALRNRNLNSFF